MSEQTITINVQARGIKTTTKKMNGLTASLRVAGRAARDAAIGMAIVGGAVAGAGRKLIKASDAYTNLTNQTKVFSNSSGQAAFKMQDTINIARKMNTSLTEVGTVYQRISMIQAGAGFNDETASKMVENLTKAVKLSGATAQEAEGALRQFSQGLAANRLSGQELNSVLEQTPMIAQLLAEKLGVATGALRQMGKDGLLTTKVLVDTFGGNIDSLEKKFAKFGFTLEAQMASVKREATLAAGKLMHLSKVSKGLADNLRELVTGPLIRMNEMLEKGGEEAETLTTIFKMGLGLAVGVATVAVGALAIAVGGLLSPFAAVALAVGGIIGAFFGWKNAQMSNVESLDKLIAKQKEVVNSGNLTSVAVQRESKKLEELISKRKELVDALKEEQKAQDDKAKNNAKTMKAFVDGTLTMAQAQDALRYGADASVVIELNKQKALTETAAIAKEAADAQLEAQADLVAAHDKSGNALRTYSEEMATLGTLHGQLSPDKFKEMALSIQAAFDATDPLVKKQNELIAAQDALKSKHDEAGNALRVYNEEMATLQTLQGKIDPRVFERMAASIKAARDAANPLVKKQKELIKLQDALKSEYDKGGTALRVFQEETATLLTLQGKIDPRVYEDMKAGIQAAWEAMDPLVQKHKELIAAQDALVSKHDAAGEALRAYTEEMATLQAMRGMIDSDVFDRIAASIHDALAAAHPLVRKYKELAEAQDALVSKHDESGNALKTYNEEMATLQSMRGTIDDTLFNRIAASIVATLMAAHPLGVKFQELVDAQQALREQYDVSGEALKKYNAEMALLRDMKLDDKTFQEMAAGIRAALDATNPLIEAQKELVKLQDALKSKHDAAGQAIRDYNADIATLQTLQGTIDTATFDRMKASIEAARDEASGLNDEFDKIVANLDAVQAKQAKAAKDLAAGLSMSNQIQADNGNPVPQLTADYDSDVAALNAGIASPDASQAEIEAMKEALELRAQSHEMDLLQAEHKASMLEMNQGLMDQTITLGEMTAGVTASMAQGFMNVAKEAFNISGQIANMTSFAINGLADSITSLAMGGKADFKALGLAFVKMIIQMIVKLTVMMALITAISLIPGGSAVLQMMGMGAGGGAASASTTAPAAAGGGFSLKAPSISGGINSNLGGMSGFASGGPVGGGVPILVGERGPELFVPPQSGSIKNNTTTQGMMQQEPPQVTVVNVDSSQNTLDALGSEEGENLIMNVIQRNPEVLRAL
jgi:lambda family phage tail tape measure protein